MIMKKSILKTDNIASIFTATAMAMILAEFTSVITDLSDGIITSRFLGADVYSGISILKPFTSIVLVGAGFFSTGCSIVTSQLVGKGMKREANEAFHTAVLFSLIFSSLVLAACLLSPSAILRMCGIDQGKYPELNRYLFSYLNGYIIGVPALMLINVVSPVLVMDSGKKSLRNLPYFFA